MTSNAAPTDPGKKAAKDKALAAKKAAEAAALVINRLDETAQDKDGKTPIKDTVTLAEKSGSPKDKRELAIDSLTFEAVSPGRWAGYLYLIAKARGSDAFDLTVTDSSPGGSSESFIKLTVADGPRRVDKVLENESQLLRWKKGAAATNYASRLQD